MDVVTLRDKDLGIGVLLNSKMYFNKLAIRPYC
jgi:hypothetical protein